MSTLDHDDDLELTKQSDLSIKAINRDSPLHGDVLHEIVQYVDMYPNNLRLESLPSLLRVFPSLKWNPVREETWKTKANIASLCYVAKGWLYPIRRVLYRVIPSCDQSRLEKFQRTVRANAECASYVRLLCVRDGWNIAEILPFCTFFFDSAARSFFAMPALPTSLSRTRHLALWVDYTSLDLEKWIAACRSLRELEYLEIRGSTKHELPSVSYLSDLDPQDHFLPSLRAFYHDGFLGRASGFFIPPTTANTLQVLILGWELEYVDPNSLHCLLCHHILSLRYIGFADIYFTEDSVLLDHAVPQMKNLKVLSIITSSGRGSGYSNKIFSHLPKSLAHLRISEIPSEDRIFSLLREKNFRPCLKSIVLFPQQHDEEQWWSRAVGAAADMGIHFQVIHKFADIDADLEMLDSDSSFWLGKLNE